MQRLYLRFHFSVSWALKTSVSSLIGLDAFWAGGGVCGVCMGIGAIAIKAGAKQGKSEPQIIEY